MSPAGAHSQNRQDIQHTAEKTVSASRGCLEPCIRKVFKHLTSTNLAFSSDEECASTTAEGTDAVSQPPSQDVFVPFPRTSGVRISPSGLMVAFGLHQPLVEIVQAASPVPLASTRTPRSFHDYLQLTEGKEHLFCKAADRQQRLLQTGDQAVGDTCSQLKRSLSADAVCAGVVRETIPGTSSSSLMTHGSPKNANRRRHFSGKTSGESRKVSTASTGKAPVVGTEQPTIVNQRTQMRRTSYATRFTPFHASNSLRKASFDRTRSNDLGRRTGLSNAYYSDERRTKMGARKISGSPRLSHFLSLGDVQSLTMMGFAMAAIDAQSSPPALLLTAPSQVAAVALKQPQRTSFTYFRPCPLEQQKSPLRRAFQQVHQSATGIQASRRSKSTAMLPNLALLEAHEPLTLTSMERADEQSQSATLFIKRASLKPTTGDSTPTRTSHQATTVKSDKSLTDQSTYENGTSVPSYARTRSSSCSVNPLPSTESITTDPSESPQPSSPGTAPCYKVSVTTDIAGSEVFRSRQSSEEIANIALLQQHFREQVLMDIGGVTGEEPQQDAPYTSHVW
ncbi:hypothetical protein EGR_04136 [Echinococcus granulosus]|uniref:Uncharacterized protein n=1 Tax=Echinococcus granulosus TaxID=6210 RepID=W6UJ85_ECHGR|nr:hypothetical protein EGR_04131 [Echinococcus granulosus]XP_024352299.1 hypothetical protein EGR_04136 [Echinococcus granulosus]EUB61098.1 hypothetical protein EGR_04131 [Echinococcus granulosus]EUB61103.1 hypothetical protein EGR_04136 [Echinococcus granulosus]